MGVDRDVAADQQIEIDVAGGEHEAVERVTDLRVPVAENVHAVSGVDSNVPRDRLGGVAEAQERAEVADLGEVVTAADVRVPGGDVGAAEAAPHGGAVADEEAAAVVTVRRGSGEDGRHVERPAGGLHARTAGCAENAVPTGDQVHVVRKVF